MSKLSIRDLELTGNRVFIRVDFNVPLDGATVTDDTRIRETLPTLRFAMERGAKVVLAAHLGRPKGKVNPKYSLAPVAARLRELLGKPVEFATDCVGADAETKSKALRNGDVLLLENVRYHAEEEANDQEFSKQLAALCDGLFVCDAFVWLAKQQFASGCWQAQPRLPTIQSAGAPRRDSDDCILAVVKAGRHRAFVDHDGTLKTLKRFKDEVSEVNQGYECGMAFENYQDIQTGDVIECFEVEEVARTL